MSSEVSRAGAAKSKRGRGGKRREAHHFAPSVPFAPERKTITQAAVKASLRAGAFVDIKFYAFSRRQASGVVDKPQALYANSAILRASSKYFEGCKILPVVSGRILDLMIIPSIEWWVS